MNWTTDNWKTVLNALRLGRRVVPIIGEELQMLPDKDGVPISFAKLLARRLLKELPSAQTEQVMELVRLRRPWLTPDAPFDPSLHDVALAPVFLGKRSRFVAALSPHHNALVEEALAHLFPASDPPVEQRHPLRLLAEISSLPLYITTTPDSLMKRVLMKVRGLHDPEDVRGFQLLREVAKSATTADMRGSLPWDLPPGWDPSPLGRPFLYHLFGRLEDPEGSDRFDVTEEDHFEMLWRLQSESWGPEQLIRELKPSQILILGQPLPEWHGRFFVRLLRGQRLSADEGATTEGIIDPHYQPGPTPPLYQSLAAFLDHFSQATRIYRDGSPETFVRELHALWQAQQGQFAGSAGPGNPQADLDHDGVFISYSSRDSSAAEKLAASLRNHGIKTYLDKSRARDASQLGLGHGSNYDVQLKQNVEKATFVLPLLSVHTQTLGGYFRREWKWACEHNTHFNGMQTRGYLRPVVVDGSDPGKLENLPPEFREAHTLSLFGGECTLPFIQELKEALKTWSKQN